VERSVTVAETPEQMEARDRVLALPPDSRKALAEIMRAQLDAIPEKIDELRRREADLIGWLSTFAPEFLPEEHRKP